MSKPLTRTILIPLVMLFTSATMAQKINEIPNADFEDWTGNAPTNYGAFQPPNGMFRTVFQSTKAPSGNSALHLKNYVLMGQVMPAGVWFCKGDCSTPPAGMEGFRRSKFPVTKRYMTLCGYYKISLKGGDKLWVSISMFKGDSAIGGSDAGTTQYAFLTTNTNGQWKRFDVPIVYFSGKDSLVPDGAFLELAIVNKAFPQNPYLMAGTAGSEVFIDKLTFCKGKEDIFVSIPDPDSKNDRAVTSNFPGLNEAGEPGYYQALALFSVGFLRTRRRTIWKGLGMYRS